MTARPYVFYGGAMLPPPPYTCNDTRFVAHVFKGDRQAQQRFVDATLNAASSPGRYRVLTDFVFLLGIASARVGSAVPPYSVQGTLAEADIGFWIAVGDTEAGNAVLLQPAYCFVDNWFALAGGREIWGFPKALGVVSIGDGRLQDAPIAVSSLVIERFAPHATAALRQIFELRPPAEADADAARQHPTLLAALAEYLVEAVEWGELLIDLVRRYTLSNAGAMVLLKQFPCAGASSGADYAAVVQCTAPITALRGFGRVKGGYELTLAAFDSHPIARDSGLPDGPQTSLVGFWADLDFEICVSG